MFIYIYIYGPIYVHGIVYLISQGSLVHRRDTQRSPSSFAPVEDIASWFSTAQTSPFYVSATYWILKLAKLRLDKEECWKKSLEFGRFQNPSEMLQNTSNMLEKKAKVCRFAYGFHMSTTRNLSKVRQTIMPLAKPCILSTFDRRKVVWKAQHFPKEHLKCTETQCVFHSSKSYVFISSLRNAYHFST